MAMSLKRWNPGKPWVAAALILLASGCASAPVVPPTDQELEAVRGYKKTLAIVEFTDEGSPIQGIQAVAQSKLENLLVGHFNLVEREKIEQVMAERNLGTPDAVERMTGLGKLLGADYVAFGNAIASLSRPEIKQTSHRGKKDRFYGRIWNEVSANAEVSLKIVSVSNGVMLYAGKKNARTDDQRDQRVYDDEEVFKRDSTIQAVGSVIGQVVDHFSGLEDRYSLLAGGALDQAVAGFRLELISRFPQYGEILQILSNKEVLINLGSAYGIQPGHTLIVWSESQELRDPKTGLQVTPKEQKGVLKVTKVTSGLTCVAKGSARIISSLRVGDKIYTHR